MFGQNQVNLTLAILARFPTFEPDVGKQASITPCDFLAFSMVIGSFLGQHLCESNLSWCSIETNPPYDIQSKLLLVFFGWLF